MPSELENTAARSPTLYAYYAALNLLDARVLFSPMMVRELLDPAIRGDRLAIERHHLFPVAYLKLEGYELAREYDQLANFALLEWPDNAKIGDSSPADYAPSLFARLTPVERDRMNRWHALPPGWETMAYPAFLAARRKLIAAVVRDGFAAIGRSPIDVPVPPGNDGIAGLIAAGENGKMEFKATARWSLKDDRVHDGVEQAIAKTIAGFLNTAGGTLIVGVGDDGEIIGLDHDYSTLRKPGRDGFELWLSDMVQATMGKNALLSIEVGFEQIDGRDLARISVTRAPRIIFLNMGKGPPVDDVFVRFGNSTRKLTPAELLQYHADWGSGASVPSVMPDLLSEGL